MTRADPCPQAIRTGRDGARVGYSAGIDAVDNPGHFDRAVVADVVSGEDLEDLENDPI